MKRNAIDCKLTAFILCSVLLSIFVLITSAHEYEYMLNEAGSELISWCQLPVEKDPARKEMYMVFLVLFGVMGLIFLRKKNIAFIVSMLIVFCYAIYSLLLKDMICDVF